ncbi:MAG: hypothetical protein DRR19_18950 [Candidatus Parabeggiatoa sp. nov. 1]|nr:MAG: hypothetical protein DRR19_18950 [Gammaproteobacteria bacterium]
MMRKYGRVDNGQQNIVDGLREIGASVVSTASQGNGFPDIVVGYRGINYLFEVKSSKGKLTPLEREFSDAWQGKYKVIRTVEEAFVAVGAWRAPPCGCDAAA